MNYGYLFVFLYWLDVFMNFNNNCMDEVECRELLIY